MVGLKKAHEPEYRGIFRAHFTICFFLLFLVFFPVDLVTAQSETESRFNEAVTLFHQNEREEAIDLLDEVQPLLCSEESRVDKCIEIFVLKSLYSRRQRDFEASSNYIQNAEQKLAEYDIDEHPMRVRILSESSYLNSNQSEFDKAIAYASEAVELVEKKLYTGKTRAWAYLALGHAQDEQGNFGRAVDAYKEGINALQPLERDMEVIKMLTQVHNNIGIAYRRLGQLDEAMNHYQANLALVREAFGDDDAELAFSYNSIGTVYYSIGDYGTAGDYFQMSAEILITNFGEIYPRTAIAFNNAGLSYFRMGDLDQATEMMERSQSIRLELFGEDHEQTAVGYRNLASIYSENEEYEAALNNYIRSIEVSENVYGENHPNLVDSYIQIGGLYIQLEEYVLARENLVRAESIIRERIGDTHPDIADIYLKIGRSHAEEENLDQANEYFIRSFNQLAGNNAYEDRNFSTYDITYPIDFIEVTKALGDNRLSKFKINDDAVFLHEALEFYELSTEMIEMLQTRYQSESSKLNLLDANYSIYTNSIEAFYQLYEKTSEMYWLDKILEYSELSRAKIANELLQEIEARNFGDVPEDILREERELNSRISHYYQQIHTEQERGFDTDESKLSAYRDSLFYTRRELEEFTVQLEENYPAYFALKYDKDFTDRGRILELLSNDQSYVSYVVSDEIVYAIIVDHENYRVLKVTQSEGLEGDVEKIRQSVTRGETNHYKNLAYSLYQRLVEPLEQYIGGNSLVIAPDQMLHYLPFELLLTDEAHDAAYHNLAYLIRERNVTYAPSATVLNTMTERRPENPRNLFAVAPYNQSPMPASGDGSERYSSGLQPLPLTLYETTEISKLFSERRRFLDYFFPERTSLFVDEEATKQTLTQSALTDYGFIHFATHAFVNESDPALSGIAMRPDDDGNGIAYVSDIYNMQMNADLVVLSACETGLGRMYKGEGLIGFTRAFIYAGASNLVVSMWKVNDQPTANLMIDFYKHIRRGSSYGESLRQAKLSMIEHPEYAAPRNWAAFVLQGK